MHPTAPLSSFNKALAIQLRTSGSPKRVLDNVLKIVQEIKKQNLRMDINTYSALLTAYSRARDLNAMMSLLDEMKENKISPTVDSYNIVLEVKRKKNMHIKKDF
jgi:pentatricopeptide repeat protein